MQEQDMFSQYEQTQAAQAPQQPPRPIPQTALAIREHGRMRQLAITATMTVILAGLSVLGWYAMEESKGPKDVADLPVIKGNTTPYKEKPQDPGGMDIPDKGRMVFDTTTSHDNKGPDAIDAGMAQLTPPPEQPATPEQIAAATGAEEEVTQAAPAAGETEFAADAAAEPDAAASESTATEPEASEPAETETAEADQASGDKITLPAGILEHTRPEAPEEAAATSSAEEAKPAQVEAPAAPMKKPAIKVIRLADNETPAAAVEKAVAKKVAASSATGGSYRVQLGSFSSEKKLELGWLVLQKKFPDQLGSLHRSVEVADLGGKGTFYRLHAGTLDQQAARDVCDKLKSRNQGCIIVK